MAYYVIKIIITSVLVVLVSELSKKSTLFGGLLASLPIVSYFALIWLFIDTKDTERVAQLSTSVFWLVIPSLSFFIFLTFLLKKNINFFTSLGLSTGIMIMIYLLMIHSLKKLGINL